jgi:site-specific DNA-adenine methylase
MTQTRTPRRQAFRYFGAKWSLADWIISYFPPHLNYLEPCGGSAAVLLQKPRSRLETYNDIDGNVVNFGYSVFHVEHSSVHCIQKSD